jgi:putative chitinase
MNYHESARTRKTGLSTLILNKLMSGGSVGSSIKGALSDRMQASVMGLKEKFDPLNIASKLTGGSRIGPALLGRMTGRSKEDIDYFAHNRRVHRFDNVLNKGHGSGDSRKATEILENIYSFMVKTRESQIKDNHSSFKFEDERQQANQRRHDEVMNVFTEATKRNRQAVGVIAKPKAVEKPPEAPPAAPPAPPKPGVSPKPEPAKPAPPSAPAPAPAKPTVKPTEPVKAPAEVAKPPPEVIKQPPKPIETAKPVPKVEPTAPPSAAPAPPVVKPPPSAAPVKPVTEIAKTAVKLTGTKGVVLAALVAAGITSPKAQANILAQVQSESNFKPGSENLNYKDPQIIMDVFGKKRIPTLDVAKSLVNNPEALANHVYAKSGGNSESGDGWKYRGRGFIQITGKDAYKKFKEYSGIDVISNPDLLNDPEVAAKAIPWFLLKYKSYKIKKLEDLEDISKVNEAIGFAEHNVKSGEFKGMKESAKREVLATRFGNEIGSASIENADMKKSMNQTSNAQPVVINNTTNVSNSETTVMSGSDRGSENPQYKRK